MIVTRSGVTPATLAMASGEDVAHGVHAFGDRHARERGRALSDQARVRGTSASASAWAAASARAPRSARPTCASSSTTRRCSPAATDHVGVRTAISIYGLRGLVGVPGADREPVAEPGTGHGHRRLALGDLEAEPQSSMATPMANSRRHILAAEHAALVQVHVREQADAVARFDIVRANGAAKSEEAVAPVDRSIETAASTPPSRASQGQVSMLMRLSPPLAERAVNWMGSGRDRPIVGEVESLFVAQRDDEARAVAAQACRLRPCRRASRRWRKSRRCRWRGSASGPSRPPSAEQAITSAAFSSAVTSRVVSPSSSASSLSPCAVICALAGLVLVLHGKSEKRRRPLRRTARSPSRGRPAAPLRRWRP